MYENFQKMNKIREKKQLENQLANLKQNLSDSKSKQQQAYEEIFENFENKKVIEKHIDELQKEKLQI